MTQKELNYMEDAVGHEKSIIKILEESINNLDDERFINFMNNELEIHHNLEKKLISKMEEKTDE